MAYPKTTWANSPAGTSFINATNLNKIETGLFDQDARITTAESNIVVLQTEKSGWIVAGTMTYASANTITVASGAALIYRKGDRLRLKQGAGYKYFYIITVADTLLTVTGGSDFTVANATITDMYYSHEITPVGFPEYFNWAATPTNLTVGAGGTLITRFTINNTTVNYNVLFVYGSGSAVGTVPSISLPLTPAYVSPNNIEILDSGTAAFYGIMIATLSNSLVFKRYDGVAITATAPMTWTTNDSFYGTGSYFI